MTHFIVNTFADTITLNGEQRNASDHMIKEAADLNLLTLAQLRAVLGKKPATKGKAVEQVWTLMQNMAALVPAAPAAPAGEKLVTIANLGEVRENTTVAVMAALVGTKGITLEKLVEGTLQHYVRPQGGEMTRALVLRRLGRAVAAGKFTVTEA
jgi:sulfite reductase beta subunit-like hemoprotein